MLRWTNASFVNPIERVVSSNFIIVHGRRNGIIEKTIVSKNSSIRLMNEIPMSIFLCALFLESTERDQLGFLHRFLE